MYKALDINRVKLTLMGVQFPDFRSLERTATAMASNMFEGFEPSKELIQLYLESKDGRITDAELVAKLHDVAASIMDERI